MTAAGGSDGSEPAPGHDQRGHDRPESGRPEGLSAGGPGPALSASDRPKPAPERLRRRLDAVFGDVLPDVTRDEASDPADAGIAGAASADGGPDAPGAGRAGADGADGQDAWLRANRPPHHDRD